MPGLTRAELAARVALDIPDGSYVNLGIGVPTLVADYLPRDREIVLHTENGMLGMGPAATQEQVDLDLINAGKVYVTETMGASYFDHATSFAIMRGGHLDVCVLGAYQVSRNGDLANWKTNAATDVPGVGGAMDLVVGAKHVYVVMDLFDRWGESKLVKDCTYPLTGRACVDRIYTDFALFAIADGDVRVVETYGGLDVDTIRAATGIDVSDARGNS